MVDTANSIFRDFVTDGVPSSGSNKPKKTNIRAWGTYVESLATLAFTNGKVYATKAALSADLVPAANTPALVTSDSTTGNNGLYMKVGATTVGSWTQLTDFVPGMQFIRLTDAGAGTPNAIIATSSLALPASYSALLILNVYETNTGAVTLAVNGGPAKPLVSATGAALAAGALLPAMALLAVDDGTNFRILTDYASAANLSAAETSRIAAQSARDLAQSYASTAAAQSNVPNYGTTVGLSGITVPVGLLRIATSGYTAVGDGAGVDLVRVSAQPSHPGRVRTADRFMPDGSTSAGNGGWWVFDETVIEPMMLGASASSAVDSASAIRDALTVHRAIPGSKVLLRRIYGVESAIVLASNDIIDGIGLDVCGLLVNGNGSFHAIYGTPETPAHNAKLRHFSVWAKKEAVSTGPFDGIRIHNARGLILDDIGIYDGDAISVHLIDCEGATITGPRVGSSTEARYASDAAWGIHLDGCGNSTILNGYGSMIGMGFAINGDDSYRRSYAFVSSLANDELTCSDPYFFTNLVTGDEVRLFLTDGIGVVPAGVTENAIYYAIKSGTESDRIIKLAATLAAAVAGTPAVDITSVGSGTTETSNTGIPQFMLDKNPITTSAVVDPATDSFTVDATYYRSFTTGIVQMYVTTTGVLPAGLSASQIYWGFKAGSNVVKLYDTSAHAVAGGATGLIDITDAGSGTHTLRLAKVGIPVRSGSTINVTPALFELLRTGDPIFFRALGGVPPAPLVENTVYYVIHTSTYGYIQVATSVANARAGTAITLTDDGSGTQNAVFHSSFGGNLSDSLTRRPAGECFGNRIISSRIERHKHHAFNINSGLNNSVIGCVAADFENITAGVWSARGSFQAKHSTGSGSDKNRFIACHAIRPAIGFFAQETRHTLFADCVADEAELYGYGANSAEDAMIVNCASIRAKLIAFYGLSSSTRLQIHGFIAEAHPNGTSTLIQLEASGAAIIGAGRHNGAFAFALDIDSGSGNFDILNGFRTNGLPIRIVPTTGRYPVNHQSGEIDLSVTGIRCLGINVSGLHVARVTKLCTVATTGSPTLAVGRRDSTGALVAATAPPATADLSAATMSPADATWVLAAGKTPAAEVVVAGTGKVMVEMSGFAST
ncbi:hypothetical protein [Mesorhizobium sp. M0118]|uniref:hypothetical protein n=1 Tax=Mesorhizobium sp. M0118 TaxID=2956884 RepID=UPI003338E86C